MYADFIYAQLYMESGYPTVDINYANYIWFHSHNCIKFLFA